MLWLCVPYFINSFRSGEVSSNAGGLLIWPAKGLILLGFISLVFQWLSELIKRVAIMKGQLVDEESRPATASKPRPSVSSQNSADTNTPKGGEPPGDGIR